MTDANDLTLTQAQPPSLYETDFYKWTQEMATLLRDRSYDQVDWDNLVEEIESLGRSEKRALTSQIVRLVKHLLALVRFW